MSEKNWRVESNGRRYVEAPVAIASCVSGWFELEEFVRNGSEQRITNDGTGVTIIITKTRRNRFTFVINDSLIKEMT